MSRLSPNIEVIRERVRKRDSRNYVYAALPCNILMALCTVAESAESLVSRWEESPSEDAQIFGEWDNLSESLTHLQFLLGPLERDEI